MDYECPKCGSKETRATGFNDDSLEWLEVRVICDECGNTGTASFTVNSSTWEEGEEEVEEDEFILHYECSCGTTWEDKWTAIVDDDCPECLTNCSPVEHEEVTNA